MESTYSSVCERSPETDSSPFTLASTLQHIKQLSMPQFQQLFSDVYTALHTFTQNTNKNRAQLTVGIELEDSGAINCVSTPAYRTLSGDSIKKTTPETFESYDLYLSFWTDEFTPCISTFKQYVRMELLRVLVVANRRNPVLPDDERTEYETQLAAYRSQNAHQNTH